MKKVRSYIHSINPGDLEGGRNYAWVECSEKISAGGNLESLQLLLLDYQEDLAQLNWMKNQFDNIGGWELYEGANEKKRSDALGELKRFFKRGSYQGNALASPIRERDAHTVSVENAVGSRGGSLLPQHLRDSDNYNEIYEYGIRFFNDAVSFIEEALEQRGE